MRSKTALRRDPSKPQTGGGLTQSLQRLSPGVYRDAGGKLTNQSGRALPQQSYQQNPTSGELQRPQNMNPMQRPMGPIRDPGYFNVAVTGRPAMGNLPGRLPPGSNPYDVGVAISGQQPEQQMNPSMQPGNYQPGTYRPWYLPPQNAPWWSQPQSRPQEEAIAQPAVQPGAQPMPPMQGNAGQSQPMSFEDFIRSKMIR